MITHVCFIALTFAVSLRRCLDTWPDGLVFNQLSLDPANVNACKNLCDPFYKQQEKCRSEYFFLHVNTEKP